MFLALGLKCPLLMKLISIELDGSLVKQDSRRWHHSLGNALWHTVCFNVESV